MNAPLSGAEILARIKPQLPEEHVELCLRPDLENAFQVAEEKLYEAQAKPRAKAKLNEKPLHLKELAEDVARIENEMRDASVWFRFKAISADRFHALKDNHPPRPDDVGDTYAGYNRDAVLTELTRMSLYEPEFDDASWAELMRVISPGQLDALRDAANRVNRGVVEAPKSERASQILHRLATD